MKVPFVERDESPFRLNLIYDQFDSDFIRNSEVTQTPFSPIKYHTINQAVKTKIKTLFSEKQLHAWRIHREGKIADFSVKRRNH